jgi:hypothetical protein
MNPGPQLIVGVEQEGLDLVGGLGAGFHRAAPGDHQKPQLADEATRAATPLSVTRRCGSGAGTGRQNTKAPGQPNYESAPNRTGHLSPAATGTATANMD